MTRRAQTWDCGELGREEEEEGGVEGVEEYGALVARNRSLVSLLLLTERVCAGCCFADQAKAGGAGTWCSGGESLTVGRGRGARLGQRRLGLIHLSGSHTVNDWITHLPSFSLIFSRSHLRGILGLPWGRTARVWGGRGLSGLRRAWNLLPQAGSSVQPVSVWGVRRTPRRRVGVLRHRQSKSPGKPEPVFLVPAQSHSTQ